MDLATFAQPALIEQRFLSTCIKQKVSGLVFFHQQNENLSVYSFRNVTFEA
jgi:hypothetical protein